MPVLIAPIALLIYWHSPVMARIYYFFSCSGCDKPLIIFVLYNLYINLVKTLFILGVHTPIENFPLYEQFLCKDAVLHLTFNIF